MKTTITLAIGIIIGAALFIWIGPIYNWRSIDINTDGTWTFKSPLGKVAESSVGKFILQDVRSYEFPTSKYEKEDIISIFVDSPTRDLSGYLVTEEGDIRPRSIGFDGPNPFGLPEAKEGMYRIQFLFQPEMPLDHGSLVITGRDAASVVTFSNLALRK